MFFEKKEKENLNSIKSSINPWLSRSEIEKKIKELKLYEDHEEEKSFFKEVETTLFWPPKESAYHLLFKNDKNGEIFIGDDSAMLAHYEKNHVEKFDFLVGCSIQDYSKYNIRTDESHLMLDVYKLINNFETKKAMLEFKYVFSLISEKLNQGKSVLIYNIYRESMIAEIAIFYLMENLKISFSVAFHMIYDAFPCISVNVNFIKAMINKKNENTFGSNTKIVKKWLEEEELNKSDFFVGYCTLDEKIILGNLEQDQYLFSFKNDVLVDIISILEIYNIHYELEVVHEKLGRIILDRENYEEFRKKVNITIVSPEPMKKKIDLLIKVYGEINYEKLACHNNTMNFINFIAAESSIDKLYFVFLNINFYEDDFLFGSNDKWNYHCFSLYFDEKWIAIDFEKKGGPELRKIDAISNINDLTSNMTEKKHINFFLFSLKEVLFLSNEHLKDNFITNIMLLTAKKEEIFFRELLHSLSIKEENSLEKFFLNDKKNDSHITDSSLKFMK